MQSDCTVTVWCNSHRRILWQNTKPAISFGCCRLIFICIEAITSIPSALKSHKRACACYWHKFEASKAYSLSWIFFGIAVYSTDYSTVGFRRTAAGASKLWLVLKHIVSTIVHRESLFPFTFTFHLNWALIFSVAQGPSISSRDGLREGTSSRCGRIVTSGPWSLWGGRDRVGRFLAAVS